MADRLISDEEWQEIAEDIPSLSDPFLQKYIAGRSNLITQERTTRSDASFRASLSPIAKKACDIVERIRAHENETTWTPQVEESLAQSTNECIFPGMMFMLAKDRMEDTKLWKIVRNMPKGALLHAHMDAMVNFEFLINELLDTPAMHMSADQPLHTSTAREDAAVEFRYRAKERTDSSIWEEKYEPNSFVLLTKVADEFPHGGRPGFISWLKSRCTLSTADIHQQHHGINAIWEKFAKCFMVCASIIHYEPMYRKFLRYLMKTLKDDGVNWAELRLVKTYPANMVQG